MVEVVCAWAGHLIGGVFEALAFSRVKSAGTTILEFGKKVGSSFVHREGHWISITKECTVAWTRHLLLLVRFHMGSFSEGIGAFR